MNFEKELWTVIFALYKHEFLGYLFQPYAIQLTERGLMLYNYKRIVQETIADYEPILTAEQKKLIEYVDACDQKNVIKRFYKKFIKPADFFQKHYSKEVAAVVTPYIEKRLNLFLQNAKNQWLFIQGVDGYPAYKQINLHPHYGKIRFHLKRDEVETRYFPTTLLADKRIHLAKSHSIMLTKNPVWLLSDTDLYQLTANVDYQKVSPFLTKNHIAVPKSAEKTFYEKFLPNLLSQHEIKVEGLLHLDTIMQKPEMCLHLAKDLQDQWVLNLCFRYDEELVPATHNRYAIASISFTDALVHIQRKQRDAINEKEAIDKLLQLGFEAGPGYQILGPEQSTGFSLISFLSEKADVLAALGVELIQHGEVKFAISPPLLDLQVQENQDWFDVRAKVILGGIPLPISRLRYHILNKIEVFELPDGHYATIPKAWFARLNTLFHFSENGIDATQLRVKSMHAPILEAVQGPGIFNSGWYAQLLQKGIEPDDELSYEGLQTTLRPYQQAGYDWMCFLRRFNLGGILADDMGLGKTIQTIALLWADKKQKQHIEPNQSFTNLIVVPTSLLYNWQNELQKFAPKLRIALYAGSQRIKMQPLLAHIDVLITSYGVMRLDIQWLKKQKFNYVVIDEGQIIKNPTAKITQAALALQAKNRLVLSGTPIENSVQDLWPIMQFVNPGLLGDLNDFKQQFQVAIEKEPTGSASSQLKNIINSFILRRTKKQVAADLPDKVEQVLYCGMTEEQERLYETTKSSYRNEIWTVAEQFGIAKANMLILRGLTKLRQIANHPALVDTAYSDTSGKFEEIVLSMEIALAEKHKMLVFSQFVKHLELVKKWLNDKKIPFYYLDGSTDKKQRLALVDAFNEPQNNVAVFLISLKAGGVGLNLTAADYVFMLDPWWNPFAEIQAIDRAHRIGQNKTVFTYRFITKNTVEEKILAMQAQKKQVSNQLIAADSSFVKALSMADLAHLFN